MRIPTIVAVATVLIVAVAALTFAVRVHVPEAAPARFPPAQHVAQAQQQDLDYLLQFADLDRSFSPAARQAFRRLVLALKNRAATLDQGAFEMEVARAAAMADNGHTNSRGVAFGRNLPRIPLRLAWFDDGLFVLRANVAHADCVGARVAAIEGVAPEQLLRTLADYVGGVAPLRRLLSVNFLVAPAALHAIGIARSREDLRYDLQLADGRYQPRTFRASEPPLSADPDDDLWPVRELSPVEALRASGSRHVLDGIAALPLYLQRPDDPYWSRLIRPGLLYVHLRRLRNRGSQRLDTFLSKVLEEIEHSSARFVVVDLRASPGGDATLTAEFTARLPRLLPEDGRIYVLIGPDTFSAGLITAARLKYFGGSRSVIIGEEMGDRPQFWAEGGRLTLPNSQIPLRYATHYHDWQRGCSIAQILSCHWRMYVDGVAAGDLRPDVSAPQRFPAYARGQDAALEAVARAVAAATMSIRSQP